MLAPNGYIIARYVYDSWGNCKVIDTNGNEITSDNNEGFRNPFRYRGYFYDVETGLYFLKSRYYDPETGRFISPDGIEYADPETINGLNLYAYCANNPVSNVDPNGNAWWHWLLGIILVVAVAALTVVTAGGAAVLLGAATTTVHAVMTAAAIGGLTAGITNLVVRVLQLIGRLLILAHLL